MNIHNTFDFFLKRARLFSHPDPARDWLILMIGSAITLAGIIVWNAWAFDIVARGGVIGVPAPKATPVLDRTSLDAIHTIFTNRAIEEEKYKTGVYRYADPSQ